VVHSIRRYRALVALGLPTSFSPPCQLAWTKCLDAVESFRAEHCENRDPLVFDRSLAERSAICCCSCQRELRAALDNCCDLGVLIDSDVAMQSRVAYGVWMFRCYDSSAASDTKCLILCSVCWSCRWLCHVSTTATQHSQDFLRLSSVDFSRFSMPLPD